MTFTPYVESKTIRTTPSATLGMNTVDFDQFRQGVEILTQRHRNLGIYKISEGTVDHVQPELIFGQPKLFDESTPYQDQNLFDPVLFISGDLTFPAIVSNSDVGFPALTDGVIEPLTIRAVINFTSIEFPFQSRDIRGSLIDGNGNFFVGNDQQANVINLTDAPGAAPVFDSDDVVGSFTLPGPSYDEVKFVAPYSDLQRIRPAVQPGSDLIKSGSDAGVTFTFFDDDEMKLKILSSGSVDDGLLGFDEVSAPTGFTYESPARRLIVSATAGDASVVRHVPPFSFGTDSVAFGGLLQ